MTAVNFDRPVLGAMLMLGFIFTGPFIDLFAKLASQTLPVGQIAAVRLIVQGIILVPIAALLHKLEAPRSGDLRLYLARAALILLSTAFITAAVRHMPIADALAIFFVEPMILTLLGAVLLGEAVGWRRLSACIVGFIGALLVIQPSFEQFGVAALYPLGTAICFAFYLILTRQMAQRVEPLTLQAHTSIAAAAISIPILFAFNGSGWSELDPVMPKGVEWQWLVLTGIAAAIAHLFLSYAFRFAPTTLLGPMHYLEIGSAAILGYIVFGDVFNAMAALGVAIIVSAGLYLIWREASLARRASQPPPSDVQGQVDTASARQKNRI